MSRFTEETAVTMVPPSVQVHPRMLQPATFPPFDLYTRREATGDGFCLFRAAGEPVYASTSEKLRRAGVEMLYVRQQDWEHCLDYVEQNLPAILKQEGVPAGHVAEWAYRLACRALEGLLADPHSDAHYGRVHGLVSALVDRTSGQMGVAWQVLESSPVNYSTHAHCINVCVLLAGFAKHMLGIEDPGLLAELGLGGAMHDIGKTMIKPEILAKPARLTRQEFSQIKKHPEYGISITRPYLRRAPIARCIISQHHENACGGGYPEGRAGDSINIFARAAKAADVFDALTCHRPYAPAMDYYQALRTMVSEMRGQFDASILRKFIRYLGASSGSDSSVAVSTEAARPAKVAAQAAEEAAQAQAVAVGSPAYGVASQAVPQAEVLPGRLDPDVERTGIMLAASPEERSEVIEALIGRPHRDLARMAGMAEALQRALAVHMAASRRAADADRAKPADQPALAQDSAAVGSEVDQARRLFPLIWELDAWRQRFAARVEDPRTASKPLAEVLACINTMRQGLVRLLNSLHVELIEGFDTFDPNLYRAAAEAAEVPAEGTTHHLRRAGFLHRVGGAAEVLEPPRILLYSDIRKAG